MRIRALLPTACGHRARADRAAPADPSEAGALMVVLAFRLAENAAFLNGCALRPLRSCTTACDLARFG